MAVRQYIGARYVPVILGAWSSTTAYEPLSVVTYNYMSYTSKKQVPAGIAPTNTEYWALTGNYNGYIGEVDEALQTEATTRAQADTTLQNNINTEKNTRISEDNAIRSSLASLNNNLTTEVQQRRDADTAINTSITNLNSTLTNKINTDVAAERTARQNADNALAAADTALGARIDELAASGRDTILWFGDSFSTGNDGGSGTTTLAERIHNATGWTVINYARGSARFVNSSNTIEEQIDSAITDMGTRFQRAKLKAVVVYGGINDYRLGTSDLAAFRTAVSTCMSKCAQFGGDCQIFFAPNWIAQALINTTMDYINAMFGQARGNRRVIPVDTLLYPLYGRRDRISADGIHPNNEGYGALANAWLNILQGGHYDYLSNDMEVAKFTNANWDVSNLMILRSAKQIRFFGRAKYIGENALTTDETLICEFDYTGQYAGTNYIVCLAKNTSPVAVRLAPPQASTNNPSYGQIRIHHTMGTTINTNDEVMIYHIVDQIPTLT